MAYAEILPDEKKERVTGFTERAIRWFRVRGVGSQLIMTDNRPGYDLEVLRKALEARRIQHIVTRPYRHSNERTTVLTAFPNSYNSALDPTEASTARDTPAAPLGARYTQRA